MKKIEIDVEVTYKSRVEVDVSDSAYEELCEIVERNHGYVDLWSDQYCEAADILSSEIFESEAHETRYHIRHICDA